MKKNKLKEYVYVALILVLTATLIITIQTGSEAYKELLDINKDYHYLLENQRESYGEIIKDLEDRRINDGLPVRNFTAEEVYLLACCVEAEAGSFDKNPLSQQYVTQVILNRLRSENFPNTIKEVIFQKVNDVPQFSVAYNGMIDRDVDPSTLVNVYRVLLHGTDLPEYVCYFYADSVKNNWVNTLEVYDTVQGTVFAYSEEDL